MKKLFAAAFATLAYAGVNAQTPAKPEMKNAIDSFSYALGLNVANSLKDQGVHDINTEMLKQAFNDVLKTNTPGMTQEVAIHILQNEMQKMGEKKLTAEKAKGQAFLEQNKKKKGVTVLPNGLQYEVLTAGDPAGAKPKAIDTVRVDYVGTTIDGTEFDSSIKRGEPTEFPLNGVIKGWTEILQLMPKGSKWKVYIPSDLAYGDRGAGGHIPGGAVLIFEITLHDIKPAK
ncbi:MAG: FKBP-type peptidyl-prolyl cis-trans isomerase [Chitinophagaceae bacterium]|nr:MAG: FKBP-type peptidyl-prolyl cis-trans isomerase [Chitinophagaceae bacterium]